MSDEIDIVAYKRVPSHDMEDLNTIARRTLDHNIK